ncbi:MAG: N-acetylmuramoyl-L-alanine amidase [Butyricimonas virosa]
MAFSIFNSLFSIVNHRLMGDRVVHLVSAKNTRHLEGPDMIVLHYTAGTSAESSALFLTRPDVSASAHLVIGRDGEVFQLVPFNIEAWHAGKSWYAGRGGLNRYSIGIELDNLGKLRFSGNLFIAECGRVVTPDEVYTDCSGDSPTYWHRYTARQIRVLREICTLLEETYPIRDVVGHSVITPRKIDPGPALEFAFSEFQDKN